MQAPFEGPGEVFFALCKSVDTPCSLGLWLRWKYGVFMTEKPAMPRPELYDSAYSYSVDYLCYSYLSKVELENTEVDVEAVALAGFKADEAFNAETARRFRGYTAGGASPSANTLIHAVSRKIAAILGPFPGAAKVLEHCRLGNGASNTLSRARARFDKKMLTLPFSVSAPALSYAEALIRSDPHWLDAIRRGSKRVPGFPLEMLGVGPVHPSREFRNICEVTDYASYDTVPKTLWVKRTIAKEPVLNGILQQGAHLYLRKRLKRFGIDLTKQEVNQTWAELAGSLGLATLDLKSASNSVVREVLKAVFPIDWFNFLDSIRSRKVRFPDGTTCETYMFSSMGNAFTFELETLVFYAILAACCPSSSIISAYGDDLICPQSHAEQVVEALTFFGFRVNTDKSFLRGRFFESCGKHYFDGVDVTPVYQKKNPVENEAELIRAHNRLFRWDLRLGIPPSCSPTLGSRLCLRRQTEHRLYGPIVEGDFWFLDPHVSCFDLNGHARVRAWVPQSIPRRTWQGAAYSYSLRLQAERGAVPERREAWPDWREGVNPSLVVEPGVLDDASLGIPSSLASVVELGEYGISKKKLWLADVLREERRLDRAGVARL